MHLKIIKPMENAIYQRESMINHKRPENYSNNKRNQNILGEISVQCKVRLKSNLQIFARWENKVIQQQIGDWQQLKAYKKNNFSIILSVPRAGWYRIVIQIRSLNLNTKPNSKPILEKIVHNVGVGEVFIIAGQSNSANCGSEIQKPHYDSIYAWNGKRWQKANDPQPLASDNRGSPWPAMADKLFEKLEVPIGLISVGFGGTAVGEWQPGHKRKLYKRLQNALKDQKELGARAILWHQGESDANNNTETATYIQLLENIIHLSWEEFGKKIPWMIAQAAYLPDTTKEQESKIIQAQKEICDNQNILEGPTTEDLTGEEWRFDLVHFNSKGLQEHGSRWALKLINAFFMPEELN